VSAPDLTRWNRAGLARFRYLDGNAVTFLEELRAELVRNFPDPEHPLDPLRSLWKTIEAPSPETDDQRRERMAQQYGEVRTDWAWEILRAFARAGHVLGEHVDAYANEGYLRTATQWDAVRKLVAVLDVHPAPPASASTPLVISAKGEAGLLAAGFAVRYSPADGGAPAVFETLADLPLDPALNALRLAGWNRSPAPLVDLPPARPLSAIARRAAIVVEGVGPIYSQVLDSHAPLGARGFTVADFRGFDPAQAGQHVLPLWEAKSKAEILLDFPWTTGELAALGPLLLPEVLSRTPAELAATTQRDAAAMARLLEDLRLAEAALDERVFAATRLADLLAPGAPPPTPPPLWTAPAKSGISAGQLALVVREVGDDGVKAVGAVVQVSRVETATGKISLASLPHQPGWERWTRGVSSLLAAPQVIAVARLAGAPNTLTFAAPHGIAAGDTVAWQAGAGWTFAAVARADERSLLLSGAARPTTGAAVFRAAAVQRTGADLFLPLGYRAAAVPAAGGLHVLADSERSEVKDNANVVRLYRVTLAGATSALLVHGGLAPAGTVSAVAAANGDGKFSFDGKPGKLAGGQWAIGDVGDVGDRLVALRIARIEPLEDHFTVTFESVTTPAPAVAGQPVDILMGAGAAAAAQLTQAHLRTVGALAAAPPALPVAGLKHTTFVELRAKARTVTGFSGEESDLAPLLDQSLPQVLAKTAATLADELGKPDAWAADLLDRLRLMQALIDEPAVAGLLVRDLLPLGPPQPVAGFELTRLDRLYGVFQQTIRPHGWDVNDTPVTGSSLVLELAPPSLLANGRRLVLERTAADGTVYAREATAAAVAAGAPARTMNLTPALTAEEGFTLGNLVLHANVTRAGHGEAKPAKVLGSGDATRRGQSFVLQEKNIAFVADPLQPAGVAAAVAVTVAGQTWRQMATLRDSGPTDAHYEVSLTEDGFLAVTFGDGTHGRRLPTGTNNVRVSFRSGSGLAGNLPPGRLAKPARPNPRVAAVSQPLAATGGNDREEVDALKAQAPASVLTLERAVSLADFTALAARQSSVWQARAFALPTGDGRHASLEIVVVPAGGGSLGSLAADLGSFLTAHALPGVDVLVSPYEPQPFDLDVTIQVDSTAFDRDETQKSLAAALLDAFGLRRRALGADLFASEVYAVVEGVTGVASSLVALAGSPTVRLLPATPRQVVYLDPALSRLTITVRELVL